MSGSRDFRATVDASAAKMKFAGEERIFEIIVTSSP